METLAQLKSLHDYLKRQQEQRERAALSIEAVLPYADGGAYSQDKDRIRKLRQEANEYKVWKNSVTGVIRFLEGETA